MWKTRQARQVRRAVTGPRRPRTLCSSEDPVRCALGSQHGKACHLKNLSPASSEKLNASPIILRKTAASYSVGLKRDSTTLSGKTSPRLPVRVTGGVRSLSYGVRIVASPAFQLNRGQCRSFLFFLFLKGSRQEVRRTEPAFASTSHLMPHLK